MPARSEAAFTDAMKAVVAERGEDFIDPHGGQELCSYRDDDGDPSCIVGAALDKLGLLDDADEGVSAHRVLLTLGFSERAAWAADAAQAEQDAGETWGVALGEYLSCMTKTGRVAA